MLSDVSRISGRITRLREHFEMTQAEFAKSLGVSPTRWNNFETGERRLTLDVAATICERYGVTLDWLFLGDPSGLPARLIGEVAPLPA